MRQLVLDLRADKAPTLDNYVVGDNAELLAALARLAAPSAAGAPSSHLYLWGASGSGRTHLLAASVAQALAAGRPAVLLSARAVGEELPQPEGGLLAVDDVEQLDESAQIALFNAFNRARHGGRNLLLAGATAPLGLALREDLRTRIGQTLVYQVRPLDDDTRAGILAAIAERRGLRLGADVVGFLLRHGRRELPCLVAVLDALDAASLERKRPVTLALLRELMQAGLSI